MLRAPLLRALCRALVVAAATVVLGLVALASPASAHHVSFGSAPTSPGNDDTPTWTFTNSAATCELNGPNGLVESVACAGSYTAPALTANGTYTLTVAEDSASGLHSASSSYEYDGTPPGAPTVAAPADAGNDTTVSFTLTGTESGGTWTCTLTGPGTNRTEACAAGAYPATLGGGDGTYTVTATHTDAAGNTSSTGSDSYVLDTVAPSAPGVTAPSSPGNDATPTFAVSGEAGGTWTCVLKAPDASTTTPACGAGSFTPSLAGNGTWTLSVTQTDAAGNPSAATTVTYLLDTVAPVAPGVATPASPHNDTTPTFTLTGEAGGTWTCTLTAPGGASTTPACAAGEFTPTLSGDGTWKLSVTQTDAAGNASTATTVSYLLDTVAPAAPGVAAPASPDNDTTPTFALTGEAGGTWTCTLTAPNGSTTTPACAAGTFTPTLDGDGTWTLAVTQTDAAGNRSTATTATYLLDTVAPDAPGVAAPASPGNDRTPTFTLSGEPGGTWHCVLTAPDGTTAPRACAPGDVTLDLSTAVDGDYTLTVTQTDAAGNTSTTTSRRYVLDTTPPSPPGVTGPSGPSPDRTPDYSLSGEPGGTWTCTVTGPAGTTTAVDCRAGPLTLDLGGADGTYTLTVTQTDAAGNRSGATTRSYVLDATPPAPPSVTGPSGPSNDRRPRFSLSGEPGGTWTCTLTAPGGTTTAVTCAAGDLALDLGAGADGRWTLAVTQTDAAGNASSATTVSYLLDTTAPAAPGVTGPAGPSADRTPTFTLSGEPGGTWTCRLTAPGGTTSAVTCAAGDLTLDLDTGANGTWTLAVTQTDAAGNTSSTTSVSYLLDSTGPPAPVVTGPTGPSADRTPTFVLTGEPGGTWTCTLTAPNGSRTAVPCTAGELTVDLKGADGTWTLTVVQTDGAGTTSPDSSVTYLLDTTAPAGPTVTGPGGPSSDRKPQFFLTGEDGATWTCTLRSPDGTVTVVSCTAGELTLDLGGRDGTYALSVVQADAAGNRSSATTVHYLLDTTAPAVPGVSGPTGSGSDRTPTFTLTGEDGGTWTCTVTRPDGTTYDVACAAGELTLDLRGADGTYTLAVTQADAAGNRSRASTVTYLLDTTLPGTATLTGPSGPSADRRPTFTVTGEQGGTWTCTVTTPDGTTYTVGCAAGDLTLDLTGPDGTYTLTVAQADAAANAGSPTSWTYLLDTAAPAAPGFAGPQGPSPDRRPAFRLTGEPGGTWTCTVTAPDATTYAAACAGGDLTLVFTRGDGAYTVTVVQTDAAGNASAPARLTYLLDTTPPPAPLVTGPAGPSADRSPVFELSGSGISWTCSVMRPDGSTASGACGPGSLTVSLQAADGTYTLTVTVADAAGNTSSASTTYLLDTTPPTAPLLTGDGTSDVRFGVVSEAGSVLRCRVEGRLVTVVACSASGVALATDVPVGTWVLVVVAVDAAGNTSELARVRVVRTGVPVPVPAPEPVALPAALPAPPPVADRPGPAHPAPVLEQVGEVVAEVAPPLLVFATTGQVTGRSLSRIIGNIADFDPRWRDTLRLAADAAKTGGFPLLLLLLALAFLAVQDRIDRNDPKLALAPVHGHQELVFRSASEGVT